MLRTVQAKGFGNLKGGGKTWKEAWEQRGEGASKKELLWRRSSPSATVRKDSRESKPYVMCQL